MGERVLVGSLFSGIGGLDHGLARAGFRHAFFCESDPWRRSVLAHHWPGVPIYEDVEDVGDRPRSEQGARAHYAEPDASGGNGRSARLDLLCGGFPCQDVSVAGRRAGLAGERSGLFYEFARIAESLRPRWILVENVPGLLSSNGGRDFGAVLGTLADIGYGVAWRILDSRYFGVPQRRRRVFILGALADGDPRGAAERAGEILAVGTRCERHPATRGEAGQVAAGASADGAGDGRQHYYVEDFEDGTLTSSTGRIDRHPLIAGPLDTRHTPQGHGMAGVNDQAVANNHVIASPLSHGSNPNSNMAGRRREDDENLVSFMANESFDPGYSGDVSPALRVGSSIGLPSTVAISSESAGVRRLTPVECERLQALPDGWTAHGPDSRRYAALGDAVTASVSEYIGRRLIAA